MTIHTFRFSVIAFFLCVFMAPSHAGIAIIVHPSNPESSLDIKLARKIFLGKSTMIGDTSVVAIDQGDSPILQRFYEVVARKNATKLKAYWTKMVLSGKGAKLEAVGGDDAVRAWVANHPTGISYIDASKVNDSVKVILIIE